MIAVSTAWNYSPEKSARQILTEIRETGVDTVELGYRITVSHLEQMIPLLDELGMKVCSLHNFCPVPSDAPGSRHVSNYYRLSSLNEEERELAVNWTKTTIDNACRVKAGVVVIHAGEVESEDRRSRELMELYQQGQAETDEFRQRRQEMFDQRRACRGPYLEAVVQSLREVMAYAEEKNVKIGLETRYYPMEIPNYEEIGELLGLFHGQGMHYWHDVGHAEVNSRLGITPQLAYLKKYQNLLIGFHIHGVALLRDHLAPFRGDFDLYAVMPYMRGHHCHVIESVYSTSAEDIRQAVRRLPGKETA